MNAPTSSPSIPYRTTVTESIKTARLDIQSAIAFLESQKERDSRKISKLYRAAQYLLKAEDGVMFGYPTFRKQKLQTQQQESADAQA